MSKIFKCKLGTFAVCLGGNSKKNFLPGEPGRASMGDYLGNNGHKAAFTMHIHDQQNT